MNISIKKLSNDNNEKIKVRNFIFSQIKEEYGYGYIPQYHKDIVNLNKYYINCERNNLFYILNNNTDEIIGTIAIRAYDKNFNEFKGIYNEKSTASIWRLFVNKDYRRCGLATKLFKYVEEFCYEKNYDKIYLHTHKNLEAGLKFWKKVGFNVTIDTNNKLQTVHMIKNLNKNSIKLANEKSSPLTV